MGVVGSCGYPNGTAGDGVHAYAMARRGWWGWMMAEFETLDSYICPYCGHAESIHLCGWGGPPDHMKCPVCYEMMDLVRDD